MLQRLVRYGSFDMEFHWEMVMKYLTPKHVGNDPCDGSKPQLLLKKCLVTLCFGYIEILCKSIFLTTTRPSIKGRLCYNALDCDIAQIFKNLNLDRFQIIYGNLSCMTRVSIVYVPNRSWTIHLIQYMYLDRSKWVVLTIVTYPHNTCTHA